VVEIISKDGEVALDPFALFLQFLLLKIELFTKRQLIVILLFLKAEHFKLIIYK